MVIFWDYNPSKMEKPFYLFISLCLLMAKAPAQTTIYVSPIGKDQNAGTLQTPVATLEKALNLAENAKAPTIAIQLLPGTYYLNKTLLINASKWRGKTLNISSYKQGLAILNGSIPGGYLWSRFWSLRARRAG
jgi:hypothetical protein